MEQCSLNQLQALSDKIKEEEMSILIERMAELMLKDDSRDNPPDEHGNIRKQTEKEKYASLLLRSLRIHMCLNLIQQGHKSCVSQFKEDWKEALDCLKFIEYEWNLTGEVISDAIDIILLLDPEQRKPLLRQLDYRTKLKIKKYSPLRPEVFFSAIHMTEYCLSHERPDEACMLIKNLILLSEERNAQDLNKHREIIHRALWYIVDTSHSLTCEIGDQQKKYFESITDYNASRFYWFYSFALTGVGRYDEAAKLSKLCWEICLRVEGDTSWIGARAGQMYYLSFVRKDDTGKAEEFLWDLIKKIDNNYFPEVDASADFVRATTIAELLSIHMDKQDLRNYLPEIQGFLDYCYSIADTTKNPRLTIRYAENMLSAYYLEKCDYLQAADHSEKALQAVPPNGLEPLPSDILLYTNQLLIYCGLNDAEQIARLLDLLDSHWEELDGNMFTTSRALLLSNTAAKKLGVFEQNIDQSRELLMELYQDLQEGELEEAEYKSEDVTYASWVLDMVSGILDTFSSDKAELSRLYSIITYFMDRPDTYPFNSFQLATIYLIRAQAEWQMGSTDAISSLAKCLKYSKLITASHEARISLLRFAAVVYYDFGYKQHALSILDEALTSITEAWHKGTAYLNDHKVCQMLSYVQFHFNICYSLMRTAANSKTLYNTVLRFKALPALVGRERNRLLRLAPIDKELQAQIFAAQDQLAAAEMNDSLMGTSTAQDVFVQLQSLEASFAEQFPESLNFTDISFDRVCEKLPDDSAIVEYWFVLGAGAIGTSAAIAEDWELDIFVTTKTHGKVSFNHIKNPAATQIAENSQRFVELLQDSHASVVHGGEKNLIREELYRELIAPVVPYLEGISTLYLAPDDMLFNLPFEILYADESKTLQDQYQICRLVCGRDILFYDDISSTAGDCFVLGDPDYEAERGERSNSLNRGGVMALTPVLPLPFSGIEATCVARRCRTEAHTGPAATKYALQHALPCRIIHLATHGVFDDAMESDSLYSSHLVFAGYNKWVKDKKESAYCGNGVLTADEISRMDLHQTNLVVMSACQSGLGDTTSGSTQGLMSAFSAAGVRWIVSHMWEASDFATPILMDAFYNAHLNMGLEVPEALQYAKNYLRTATIGELRRNGWLDIPRNSKLSEKSIDAILEMREANDRRKPFADEFFWGGFVVHKSR